ncbi:MAG: germination protein YpeB [Firmicutes bacterium]|nr:germination protein YpeB [Bacillota bacterium]
MEETENKNDETAAKTETEAETETSEMPETVVLEPQKPKGRFTLLICASVFLFGAMLAGLITANRAFMGYQTGYDDFYQNSFNSYNTAVTGIENNFSRLRGVSEPYAYDPAFATETFRHAETARISLASLALNEAETAAAHAYLNRVGDWCFNYSRCAGIEGGADGYMGDIEGLYSDAAGMRSYGTRRPNSRFGGGGRFY